MVSVGFACSSDNGGGTGGSGGGAGVSGGAGKGGAGGGAAGAAGSSAAGAGGGAAGSSAAGVGGGMAGAGGGVAGAGGGVAGAGGGKAGAGGDAPDRRRGRRRGVSAADAFRTSSSSTPRTGPSTTCSAISPARTASARSLGLDRATPTAGLRSAEGSRRDDGAREAAQDLGRRHAGGQPDGRDRGAERRPRRTRRSRIENAYVANGAPTLGTLDVTRDLTHRFFENQMEINGGTNDMFAAWLDAGGLTMGHFDYSQSKLYKLAQQYVLADNFFSGAFGGSFLNHQYLICACAPTAPMRLRHRPTRAAVTTLGTANSKGVPQLALNAAATSPAVGARPARPAFAHSTAHRAARLLRRGRRLSAPINTIQPAYQPSGNAPGGRRATDLRYANPASPSTLPPQTQTTIGDQLTTAERRLGLVRDVLGRGDADGKQLADGDAHGDLHAVDGARHARTSSRTTRRTTTTRASIRSRTPPTAPRTSRTTRRCSSDITDGHAAAGGLVQADGQHQPAPGLRQRRRRRRAHRRPGEPSSRRARSGRTWSSSSPTTSTAASGITSRRPRATCSAPARASRRSSSRPTRRTARSTTRSTTRRRRSASSRSASAWRRCPGITARDTALTAVAGGKAMGDLTAALNAPVATLRSVAVPIAVATPRRRRLFFVEVRVGQRLQERDDVADLRPCSGPARAPGLPPNGGSWLTFLRSAAGRSSNVSTWPPAFGYHFARVGVALDVERHHVARACGTRRCGRTRGARRRCAATGTRNWPQYSWCVAEVLALGAAQAQVVEARVGVGGDAPVARHAERVEAEVGELRERAVVSAARVAARAVALLRVVEQRQAALLAGAEARPGGAGRRRSGSCKGRSPWGSAGRPPGT